jgi:membrane protein DedA with SNARE-associated domain
MTKSRSVRWLILGSIIMAIILVPFCLFGPGLDKWIHSFLQTAGNHYLLTALTIFGLLASDILLPIPSSVVNTAAGFILGFPAGFTASWLGMMAACLAGYWLGFKSRKQISSRLLEKEDIRRLEDMHMKFGDWFIAAARAIPVLAEASVLFAGIGAMPFSRFLAISIFSNAVISGVYAFTGAFSASLNSFLLAFTASILIPAAGIALSGGRRNK